MNKIEGVLDKSDYKDYCDFINYKIDGAWLDEKLEEIYPNKDYKGLIPTLVYWMNRNDEKNVVWNRILPDENKSTICPILMCPDDNDFSCTLIVAEVKNCVDEIHWKKLGIDKTNEWDAEKVGSKVEWLDQKIDFKFSKSDYLNMLEVFRIQFAKDEIRIVDNNK